MVFWFVSFESFLPCAAAEGKARRAFFFDFMKVGPHAV
jgi:hypothetical protein